MRQRRSSAERVWSVKRICIFRADLRTRIRPSNVASRAAGSSADAQLSRRTPLLAAWAGEASASAPMARSDKRAKRRMGPT